MLRIEKLLNKWHELRTTEPVNSIELAKYETIVEQFIRHSRKTFEFAMGEREDLQETVIVALRHMFEEVE
jgi:hypothetical protein